jgi:ribonuclease HI
MVARLRVVFDDIRVRRGAFDDVDVVLLPRRKNGDADHLARAALRLSEKVVRCRWRRGRGR